MQACTKLKSKERFLVPFSLLSNCVQACITLLYPLNWQYVLIPVLPGAMIDVVCAPMPFILGISSAELPKISTMRNSLEEMIMYDLDSKSFIQNPYHDEHNIPPSSLAHLIESISRHSPNESLIFKFVSGDSSENNRNLALKIADVFLGFILQYLKNYDSCILGHQSCGFTFNQDLFINSFPPEAKKFMQELVQTQLFHCFIQEREQHPDLYRGTTFDKKLEMLAHLMKAIRSTKESRKDTAVIQAAINEIYGIVPPKMSVLVNKITGDN